MLHYWDDYLSLILHYVFQNFSLNVDRKLDGSSLSDSPETGGILVDAVDGFGR